jgi:SAM-dependent methyltransferase
MCMPARLPRLTTSCKGWWAVVGERARLNACCFPRPDEGGDAGCGTGGALEFLPLVNYFGFDPNPEYIRVAQSRYGSRGEFFCGDASSPRVRELAQGADAYLSLGVLHHLTDQQIDEILGLARACLRPGGRFVFYEPCFSANDDCVGRCSCGLIGVETKNRSGMAALLGLLRP